MNSNVLSSGVLFQLVVTERQYLDVECLFFRGFCIFEFRALILIFLSLSLSNLVMSGAKNIFCASVLPLVRISLACPSTLCTSSSLSVIVFMYSSHLCSMSRSVAMAGNAGFSHEGQNQ